MTAGVSGLSVSGSTAIDTDPVADARGEWRPHPHLAVAMVVRDPPGGCHVEFPADFTAGRLLTKVERNVYVVVDWVVERQISMNLV